MLLESIDFHTLIPIDGGYWRLFSIIFAIFRIYPVVALTNQGRHRALPLQFFRGERDDIINPARIGEKHHQPIQPKGVTGRGGHIF